VTIEFDVNNANNVNIQPLSADNNPQAGALVPQAFKDINLNTTADPDAVSGYKTAFEVKLTYQAPVFSHGWLFGVLVRRFRLVKST